MTPADRMPQLTGRNVSQKYSLICMRLFAICAGTGRGAVGAACRQLWDRADDASKLSVQTKKLLLGIFSFPIKRPKMFPAPLTIGVSSQNCTAQPRKSPAPRFH